MSHLRFNRNLKSSTKSYEAQKVTSVQQFAKSGSKKITHTTAPILTLSRLIKSNISSKNNFLNRLSLSKNKSFLNTSTKKDNQPYFLLNNKRSVVLIPFSHWSTPKWTNKRDRIAPFLSPSRNGEFGGKERTSEERRRNVQETLREWRRRRSVKRREMKQKDRGERNGGGGDGLQPRGTSIVNSTSSLSSLSSLPPL